MRYHIAGGEKRITSQSFLFQIATTAMVVSVNPKVHIHITVTCEPSVAQRSNSFPNNVIECIVPQGIAVSFSDAPSELILQLTASASLFDWVTNPIVTILPTARCSSSSYLQPGRVLLSTHSTRTAFPKAMWRTRICSPLY